VRGERRGSVGRGGDGFRPSRSRFRSGGLLGRRRLGWSIAGGRDDGLSCLRGRVKSMARQVKRYLGCWTTGRKRSGGVVGFGIGIGLAAEKRRSRRSRRGDEGSSRLRRF
jgi:hypothetical protein